MIKGSCDFIGRNPSRSANFGGHRYPGNGDIMIFVCRVTLQEHVIKVLCNFMVRSPRNAGSEDIMPLVCCVFLQNHVIKGLCDFMSRSPSR